MPTTYTWTATSLIGYPVFDGQTDVVTRVFYTVLADDGEGHTAEYSNTQDTPLDPSAPFIPFDELNNDIIIGWVQSNLGSEKVDAIENSLDVLIQRQVTPPPEPKVLPLPWVPPVPVAPVASEPVAPVAPEVIITEPASSPSLTETPVVTEPLAPDTTAPVN